MRIEVSATNLELSPTLRNYAEARVWVALRRMARRPSWVGVRLVGEADGAGQPRVACEVDVWLRGVGLVSVRHVDTNPYAGVDCAAVRLRQAITRRLRRDGLLEPAARPRKHTPAAGASPGAATPPRLAVVIKPSGARSRLSLRPWLGARYGIEQVHRITVPEDAWRQLASGESDDVDPALKDRLALSMLCRPELVVVAGTDGPARAGGEPPTSRSAVERIVRRLRDLRLPTEVVGVWTAERWDAASCRVESEEVGRAEAVGQAHEAAAAAAGGRADAGASVFGGRIPQWFAVQVWEDDGGLVAHERETSRRPKVRRAARAEDRSPAPHGRDPGQGWRRDGGRTPVRRDTPVLAIH